LPAQSISARDSCFARCTTSPAIYWVSNHPKRSNTHDTIFVQSRSRKQISVSVSFSVSRTQLRRGLSATTVHCFQPFRSVSNLGTSILLNLFCFAQNGAHIRRGRSFKICAVSRLQEFALSQFVVSLFFSYPTGNTLSFMHSVCIQNKKVIRFSTSWLIGAL
jgi:hypothetical protein